MAEYPTKLTEVAPALRAGELDLSGYVADICERIEALEPDIEALLPEPDRRTRLGRDAAELQRRYPHSAERPALYGIPVGVKDIFRVDGFATAAGSRLPVDLFAGPEADSVARLRAAGALILGKTVTTEFAYFEPGPTRHPLNHAHTPGGSSSGSAAAVAVGFCPLAVGTQTVGSVIRPAAFCGIAGFKPSYGRIDTAGVIPFSRSADHIGVFTQDVEGLALAAAVLCRSWHAVPAGGLPVLGVPDGRYMEAASAEALAAFEQQLARLAGQGYAVRRLEAFDDIAAITLRHQQLIFAEMAAVHAEWFAQYRHLYRPRTAGAVEQGQRVTATELAVARGSREELRTRLHALMVEHSIDVWLSPAAPGTAPLGLASTGDPAMNLPWTHAGLPTVTIPAGVAANGLPLGLQCSGRWMADEQLLAWSAQLAGGL